MVHTRLHSAESQEEYSRRDEKKSEMRLRLWAREGWLTSDAMLWLDK